MTGRQHINLNREWRFVRADVPGAESIDFDDSNWQCIGLPHAFDLPYFRTPEFFVGYGWYRKGLEIQKEPGRRYWLRFDAVFQVAEVFVNEQRIGEHSGGYTGFQFDITDAICAGRNLIAVRVNNNWDARLAPRAGEHIFSGGIYRDVHLVVTNEVHLAHHGVSISTPNASSVAVQTQVINMHPGVRECTLRHDIIAPDGHVVTTMTATRELAANGIGKFEQSSEPIVQPLLWHPAHPYLYTLRTALFEQDTLVDEIKIAFGFRWFEWTADRGFFLNGEHLYLRGANVHQDHAGWGIGITRAGCWRDVKLMKDAGFNFLRGSHYPHHPAFADACDRLGMLYLSEICFWGKGGFGPEGYWNASAYPVNPQDFEPFEEHCRHTLREMIVEEKNHPSIIGWSMTNEAFFTYNLDRAKSLIKDLVALSRELDPTRPAVIGGAQRGDVDRLGDVAAYNGDGARLFINPGVPNLVSEYGAISKPHDAYEPFFGELQEEQFPWRSGQAIWCGFDYGTIAGRQGLKGIVDHYRLPKRSWYWYRKEYLKMPPPRWPQQGSPCLLRLSADATTIEGTDATQDTLIIVHVCDASGRHISNSPPVTLTIESGPGEFPTGPSITFDIETDIKIVNGQAAIEFRSYHGGETVIRATSPGLKDAAITIKTIGEPTWSDEAAPLRPYIPPPLSQAAIDATKNVVNVARDRPSRASSETENHPARCANDASPHTMWKAADPAPWWQVDLEGFYQISGSKIDFGPEGAGPYIIQISQDAVNWTMAVDRSHNKRSEQVRNDIYPPGAVARYVRICGSHQLCEVEVYGMLWVR